MRKSIGHEGENEMKVPVKQKVIQALLTGAPVRAKDLAATFHVSGNVVTQALLELHELGLVERKDTSTGPGGRIVSYTATDLVGLEDRLSREVAVKQGISLTDFTGLLAAWGIRMADIKLPVTSHEMQGAWQ